VDAELADLDAAYAASDLDQQSLALTLAARLVELKARALLPSAAPIEEPVTVDAEETPEALAQRLAAYDAFREAAQVLRSYEEARSQRFGRPVAPAPDAADPPPVPFDTLLTLFAAIWERARADGRTVARQELTVLARMEQLRAHLRGAAGPVPFEALFEDDARRMQVIVTFLALLELVRLGEATLLQESPFGPLMVTM
ncbi:MAG TPA: segregation/condensation protein A, partial [Bacillota bacterium]|nr:segregation/condensation protein A [Bacillota bacterium]